MFLMINGEKSVLHVLLILFIYLYGFLGEVSPHICDWSRSHLNSLRPCTQLTNSMQQSPSREANSLTTPEIPSHIFWNPKVHYCVYCWTPSLTRRIQNITAICDTSLCNLAEVGQCFRGEYCFHHHTTHTASFHVNIILPSMNTLS